MKKFLTLIAVVLLTLTIGATKSFSTANSLELISYDAVLKGSMNDEINIHAKIRNNGSAPVEIKLKLEVVELAPTHSLLLCWGLLCYPPIAVFGEKNFPETFPLAPGTDSGNDFKCTINQGDGDGTTIVKFTFWDVNNPTDLVEFTSNVQVITKVNDQEDRNLSLLVTPNPATENVFINYDLDKPATVRLSVINQLGQEVALISNGLQQSLSNSIQFDINNSLLENGLYFVQLRTGNTVHTEKLIIAR